MVRAIALLWLLVFQIVFVPTCWATRPAFVDLDTLFQNAKEVLLVQIIEGKVVGSGDDLCGSSYVGLVEQTFKGRAKNERVEFGWYANFKIGAKYVVFLAASPREADIFLSVAGFHAEIMNALFTRCASKMPPLTIMQLGDGAFEIRESPDPNYSEAIPTPLIRVPPGLPKKTHKSSETLRLSPFLKYLEQKSK